MNLDTLLGALFALGLIGVAAWAAAYWVGRRPRSATLDDRATARRWTHDRRSRS